MEKELYSMVAERKGREKKINRKKGIVKKEIKYEKTVGEGGREREERKGEEGLKEREEREGEEGLREREVREGEGGLREREVREGAG
jgi:hypothetical protein